VTEKQTFKAACRCSVAR